MLGETETRSLLSVRGKIHARLQKARLKHVETSYGGTSILKVG